MAEVGEVLDRVPASVEKGGCEVELGSAVGVFDEPQGDGPGFSRGRTVSSGLLYAPHQGQRSPKLKVIALNGRTLTGSSSFALAISSHCPPRSSNASRVRSIGSTSHR